jgi:hypothetical protein
MADRNDERGPSPEDRSRMDEIRRAQQRPAGDPRITGERGGPGRPYHVVIDDAADKFFDSFRAPTAAQGPQRPGEGGTPGSGTGEGLFRASIEGVEAFATATRATTTELRSHVDMVGRWTADMGRFTALYREQHELERIRVDTVLTRIEQSANRIASAVSGMDDGDTGGGRHRRRRRADGSTEPIPDLDNPNPDGSFPPAPPRGPSGGGGGPGGGGGGGGRPPTPPTPPGPPHGPAAPPPWDDSHTRLRSHQAADRRSTVGGLRRQISQRAAEQLHQEHGLGVEGAGNSSIQAVTDPETGELSHFEERDASGAVLRTATPDSDEGRSMARTAIRMASISRAAGAMANGRGLGGALRGALGGATAAAGAAEGAAGAAAGGAGAALGGLAGLATKAIPVVGWGMAAADALGTGFRFAQDQRAKNAFYQNIQGGSNVSGFGQRLQEEGFAWSEFLNTGLGDEESRKAFKGISSMGFREQQRQDMLQFTSEQYKRRGMGVDQSLKAIEIAAAGANSQLVGLDTALMRVTKAAQQTGQNADVMRDKFLNSFGAATAAGFGVSAAQVAGIVTAEGPGRSRALQNVDYSGIFTEGQQRIVAAQQGISYGEQIYNNATGNTVPGLEAKDKMIDTMVNSVLSGGQKKTLDDAIAAAGGPDKIKDDPGAKRKLGLELLRQGLDPGQVKAMAEALIGPGALANVPEDDIGEYIVDQYVGGGDLSQGAEKDQAAKNERSLTRDDRKWGGIFNPDGGQSTFVAENFTSELGDELMSSFVPGSAQAAKDNAVSAYAERQDETNKIDPAIESMITSIGDKSEIGIKVQTKDGPKVVTQAEAIKYYGDQIAKGTATLVGGPSDLSGRSVGEVTGVTQKDFTGAGGRDSDTTDDASVEDVGVSEEDWMKDHPNDTAKSEDAASGGGTVTIDMTPEMKRFFSVSTTGAVQNGQVEAGAAAGLPPSAGGGG